MKINKNKVRERIKLNKIRNMYKRNGNWNVEIINRNIVMRNW